MNLDAGGVDDLRRAVSIGAAVRLSEIHSMSLGAAFEMAVAFVGWRDAGEQRGITMVSSLLQSHQVLSLAIDALDGVASVVPSEYDAPPVEVQPAPRSLDTVEWSLFGQRLKRSLERIGGFDGKRALALSKVMSELADNVIVHSSGLGAPAARAVVGYAIGPGQMAISIGDLGRGVLASLSENPTWRYKVPDSRTAIMAAVLEHASRRSPMGADGLGLHEVQKSVVDLDGSLRFRSGDAVLTLEGPGHHREIRRGDSFPMPGFQVSVSCTTSSNH
jgi:hypothetical protein